jgi:hypothetical protein
MSNWFPKWQPYQGKIDHRPVATNEYLPPLQSAVLGVQHAFAMFGATVLAPLLMGFSPNLAISMSERILIMVKNKVVLKERDAWSDLANFIGEMVAKYAESMDLDNLPDPDFYLRRERIRQLYTELYKEKNITKFRNTKISIERKVAA